MHDDDRDLPFRSDRRLSIEDNTHRSGPCFDARHLSNVANEYLLRLNEKSSQSGAITAGRRVVYIVGRVRQWIPRKVKEIIHHHWDIGVFDVAFGSIKAFGIYPALFFAGYAWTIPIMEYVPLNTQIWTAGYMFGRRHLLSTIGKFRFGHSLNRMNAYWDNALNIAPRDARHIHRFECDSVEYTVRIRQSRMRDWLRRIQGLQREANVVLQSELRGMISDKEFIYQANPLRSNAYLYEKVLIARIIATEADRPKLVGQLTPEETLTSEADKILLDLFGETSTPAYTRVFEQGDDLTATLKSNLGHGFSATSLALRWINWSYQRRIYRKLAELNVLRYRLLADVLNGTPVEKSTYLTSIRTKREEVDSWIERLVDSGNQAKTVTTKAEGHAVIQSGFAQARSFGLKARLASAAFWVSRFFAARTAFVVAGFVLFGLILFFAIGDAFYNESWLQSLGGLAWVVAVGLMVADIAVPIPTTLVITMMGQMYGPLLGGAIGTLGSFSAGVIAYGLTRFLGKRFAVWLLGDELPAAERFFKTKGAFAVACSRWLPLLPEAISGMAGLARMPFGKYCVALLCGALPMCFAYSSLGLIATITNMPDNKIVPRIISILLPIPIWWIAGRMLHGSVKRKTNDE